jgi:hypothetical protein
MSEKKSILEIAIIPIVVTIVGISGTLLITNQQENNASIMSAAQLNTTKELAEADREIKVLDIVSEQLTSSDLEKKELGLRLLGAVSGKLAEKIALAYSEGEPKNSKLRELAIHIGSEGAYRDEKKRIAEGSSIKASDQNITGTYLMDKLQNRVITITNINENEIDYRIEEKTSPWPWEGMAQLTGLKLSGEAKFIKGNDKMRVEGLVREDGSIVVRYIFLTDEPGNNPSGRVDNHIWYNFR